MRIWAYFLIGWCWAMTGGVSGLGYLAVVGPSPLRFSSPEKTAPPVALPAISELASPTLAATNAVFDSPAEPIAQGSPPVPEPPPKVETPSPATPPDQISSPPFRSLLDEPLIGPPETQSGSSVLESLVSLFKHEQTGTNRTAQAVLVPVNIQMQAPPKPPSSSATYSSPDILTPVKP